MKKILLLLFSLSTLFASAQSISDGLVAHFPFDNDYTDASGNGHTGTAIGAPEFVDGKKNTGVLFHGASTGTVDAILTNLQFAPSGSFSISLWFKLTAFDTKFGNVMIADRGEGSNGFQIRQYADAADVAEVYDAGGGWLCFTTRGIGSDKSFDPRAGVESTDIRYEEDMPYMEAIYPAEFVHLVAVVDIENNKKQIWLDKTLVVDANITDMNVYSPAEAGDFVMIGARNDGNFTQTPESPFYGIIDEVRIYSKALTSDDINAVNADVGTSIENVSANLNELKFSQLNGSVSINVNLQQSTQVHTQFFNMSGRMVKEFETIGSSGSNTINYTTNDLMKGVYIMNVICDGKSVSTRISIK